MSAAGSSASSAVSSSVSVDAGSRVRPPWSWPSRSRVLTRLPLCPIASARRGPRRYVGWAFSQIGRAGGRVAAVGDGQLATQAGQAALVEHGADHPEVLVEHQLLAVADRQPGRFLATMLEGEQAERRDGGGVGRLTPRERPPRKRHTSVQPSQPSARERPWSQARRRSASETSRASATRLPRSSAAPSGPAPVDSMTSASPATTPRRAIGRPRWRASSSSAGACAAVLVSTSRDGLSPNRTTAGEADECDPDRSSDAAPHRALGQRNRQSTAGDVLGRGHHAARDRLADVRLERGFTREVQVRRAVLGSGAGQPGVGGSGQPGRGVANQHDHVPGRPKRGLNETRHVLQQAHDADLGRRGDGAGRRLVVERDVAAGDRHAERATGVTEATDSFA